MKRSQVRTAYLDYSGRTSENVRQLSFAALGIIWVFRPSTANLTFSRTLLIAGTCAVSALVLDFLQSLYGTVAWGWFHRQKELTGLDDDAEFKAPRQMNWPTNALFLLKVVALIPCYALLLRHLARMVQLD
jgi:hypothetical protein